MPFPLPPSLVSLYELPSNSNPSIHLYLAIRPQVERIVTVRMKSGTLAGQEGERKGRQT